MNKNIEEFDRPTSSKKNAVLELLERITPYNKHSKEQERILETFSPSQSFKTLAFSL